jgi:hypothetical protein
MPQLHHADLLRDWRRRLDFISKSTWRYASMSQHTRPIWFAVLVAPWAVPLAFVLWATFATLFTEGVGGFKDWPVLFGFFIFGLPPAYAAMLIFGLPYVLWLRARGSLTFPLVCLGAMLASVISIAVFGWLTDPNVPPSWSSILLSASLGLLSGMAFCVAAGITFRRSGRHVGAA